MFFLWIDRAAGAENKRPTWASGRSSFSGAFWFGAPWLRTSGLSPDPPWPLPARLAEPAFEGRFVPDASEMMEFAALPSRVFLGIGLGFPQLVGHQFEDMGQSAPSRMPSPRVTVAVITYNRSRRLRETLAGMVRQNFPAGGWELLVIDNNSTDDTGEVVSSFVSSVPSPRRVVEARQGLDTGRHRAIAESP